MEFRVMVYRLILLLASVTYYASVSADCIDTTNLASIKDATTSLLIDTRASQLYNSFRIPGSINVPANTVASQKIWRKKSLYLIGYGYDDSRMLELCRQLHSNGFENVSVIRNGVLSSRDVIKSHMASAHTIDAQELINIFSTQQAILLDISVSRDMKGLGISGVYYMSADKINDFREEAKKSRTLAALPLIVVSSDVSAYRALYALNDQGDTPVYFVDGGTAAVKTYVEYIENVKRKAKFELQEVKKCKS